MKAVLWLILLLLAVVGVAAIVDYTGLYDIPMFDVVKQVEDGVIGVAVGNSN